MVNIIGGLFGLVITPNTVSPDEHVPEAERDFIIVKYWLQSVLTTLLFCKVPDFIIVEIFLYQVFLLNVFPNKYGFSKILSPCEIMYGLKIDYRCHLHISCGRYVQTVGRRLG